MESDILTILTDRGHVESDLHTLKDMVWLSFVKAKNMVHLNYVKMPNLLH